MEPQQVCTMNRHLLVSDTRHFRIEYRINPYMRISDQPNGEAARVEHQDIVAAHTALGRRIEHIPSAPECPDMVYTANAALVRANDAVLARPPVQRYSERPHFRSWLCSRGFEVHDPPFPFSGQGDALPCGDLLLAGYGQRTDRRMHRYLARHLGYEVVPLRTLGPQWYDLDLVVAIIRAPDTVAYCPQALDTVSRSTIRSLGLDLIEVTITEAARFALNLVSDGRAVTMTRGAPRLAATLRSRGFEVVELPTTQLGKGGGGVRCTSLTLDNPEPGDTADVAEVLRRSTEPLPVTTAWSAEDASTNSRSRHEPCHDPARSGTVRSTGAVTPAPASH
jgi:N-dimethylarginine dimethylaminohydrolase